MIPAITEVNFPSYATLSQATVSLQEMGERTISTQVKIDGSITPNFANWELRFKGERFVLPVREPQAAKDNTSRKSVIDLTFESWAVRELKRYFFVSLSEIETGVAIPDQYNASITLSLESFVQLFNKVLSYYFGDDIRMDLFGAGQHIYSTDPVSVEIDKTYIWDVLVKFYELFNVRWTIEYDSQTSAYVIKVGYTADAITDHDFEYGYQGGLLKFERQVQDTNINNILIGRGGEKNLPYRYFKLEDPNATAWAADPDAIPELANVYFDRLRDVNFRWYVRGWMQNTHRDTSWDATHTFPQYTENDCPSEFLFAFRKGKTDEKFNPVEYVKDDASITKYGERWGAVEDNDDVFPTIQGRIISGLGRVDEVVDVSPIVTDNIEAAAKAAVTTNDIGGTKVITLSFGAGVTGQYERESDEFTVPSGNVGNIRYSILNPYNPKTGEEFPETVIAMDTTALNIKAVDVSTGTEYAPYGLAAGTYRLKYTFKATNYSSTSYGYATFGFNTLQLVLSSVEENAWKPTFDIWVKNLWQTTQGANESDEDYSTRVWQSILGDRAGNEAKIVFSDGFMSVSQDYEFVIASYPVPDRSKTITSGGVNYDSEWKITLYKNDAEFQATGLYIPNATTGGSPQAGDHFFFIGVDMPFQYVEWAEETLNGALADPVINKTAALSQYAEVNPTWLITLDKVRCNTHEGAEYGQHLADRLSAGATVRIKDKRFTGGQTLTLYVQSISYIWNEPTTGNPYLVPDIEVALSDKVISSTGTVERISNELDVVKTTYAKSADIEQTVRAVGNALFLKKTGESDRSASPTEFASKVSSTNFRQGDFGGAGWGMYEEAPEPRAATRDASATPQDGNSVFEVDKLVVRKELRVNELVANQISYIGGKKVTSAAAIECSQVIEDASYYYCYFDQKQGSVANLFQVNDIALGQNFDENNAETRYYRMVVSAVGVDYIRLSKSGRDGAGAPMKGDIIVQYGNTNTASRQYVIVEDVIGGGYQRMISGLNATNTDGKEYYFAGRENVSGSGSGAGDGTRWFVGDTAREYAEWKNGILNIKGRITVRKSDGTYQAMDQYIADNDMTYLKNATNQGTLVDGGLVLTSMIQLGYTVNDVFTVMSGINGLPDERLSDHTRSIAAWYGGPMVDMEAQGSGSGAGSGYAKSLFRMDGSGYLASGKITWGKLGGGHIPGLTWNDAGTSITIGGGGSSSVIIDGSVKLVNSSGNDISDLISLVQELSSMFEDESYYEGSTLKHRIKVKSAYEGLYTEGFLSAGGAGSGSGSGGDIGLPQVWSSLENDGTYPSYNTRVIALAHIPNLPWSQITSGLPTTLAGYGITNAYTKTEVDNLIGAIDQFHYEIYASTSAVTNPQSNVLYLIGPSGSGSDKYEEYVYANSTWTKIGDTTIDLSPYLLASVAAQTYVPQTVTVNGHALSSNVTVTKGDVGLGNVDNLAASGYFTQFDNGTGDDANKVLITIGGTQKKLTVGYASNAGLLNSHADSYFATASSVTTIQGYFDANGNAKAALKLTTVSKTAWGQTYWTSGGVPDSISGNMSSVGNISMNGSISGATTISASGLVTVGSLKLASGAPTLTWDATNSAWKLEGNFYATGYVAAGGAGSGSGSGGDVSLPDVWNSMDNSQYSETYGNRKIHTNHLPTIVSGTGLVYTNTTTDNVLSTTVGLASGYIIPTVSSGSLISVSHLYNFWQSLQNSDFVDTYDNYKFAAAHLPACGTGLSYTTDSSGLATGINVSFPVTSVAGKTGAVTLAFSDITGTASTSQIPDLSGTYLTLTAGQSHPLSDSLWFTSGTHRVGFRNSSNVYSGCVSWSEDGGAAYMEIVNTITERGIRLTNATTTAPVYWDGSAERIMYHAGNFTPSDYLEKSGGTMTGTPYIIMSGGYANLSNSTYFGISRSCIQSDYNIKLAADTDGSQNEYVFITAGYGVEYCTAANGLAIGYNSLTWKNNAILHAGNYDSYAVKRSGDTINTSGANLVWGNITIYGGGANNSVNSMLIGDDALIGDCNVDGAFGIKAQNSNNAGLRFFTSSGMAIGGIQSTNGTLQWYDTGGYYRNIWHSGNSNKSDVAWACSTLTANKVKVTYHGGTDKAIESYYGDFLDDHFNIHLSSQSGDFNVMNDNWTPLFRVVRSNGYVGIGYGTTNPSYMLDVNGVIHATTGIYSDGYVTAGSASDARLKDNVRTMEFGDAMTILANVRPVRFSWNGLAISLCEKYVGNDMGMIAQEVEPYIPEAISSIYGEYKRLDYTKFIAPLVCVAKGHEERLQQAEKRIAVLEAENAELKARLNA